MQEQISFQRIIQTRFDQIRAKNPQFSRRAFSKRLGVSPGAMSEILNGKRRISYKLARKLTERLDLDPQERAELLSLFHVRVLRNETSALSQSEPRYLQLSADQFHVLGEWFHFGILTLMRTSGFKSDAGWISRRLGLSLSTVNGALERLIRLGLVQRKKTALLAPILAIGPRTMLLMPR